MHQATISSHNLSSFFTSAEGKLGRGPFSSRSSTTDRRPRVVHDAAGVMPLGKSEFTDMIGETIVLAWNGVQEEWEVDRVGTRYVYFKNLSYVLLVAVE